MTGKQKRRRQEMVANSNAVDPQLQEQLELRFEHEQYQRQNQATPTHRGSVGYYRDVIDDLTIEIQHLREELRRYKRKSPGLLREQKLFEIKIHDLSKRSKGDLETTLQDFVVGLGDSRARPSATSRPKPAKQNDRSYSHDLPEGLYPQHTVLTDGEKRRVVVKRLEQLFTAQLSGNQTPHDQMTPPAAGIERAVPVVAEAQVQQRLRVHEPPNVVAVEPAREASILPPGQQFMLSERSILNDLQSEHSSNSNRIASGANTPSPQPSPPEQRPTRLKDVDPARVQVPRENLEYIRHLGFAPPERLTEPTGAAPADLPDADGWVSLNLLYNLAQLHMVDVTLDFVRMAVLEMSTKFQLSSDRHKLRWRGGWGGSSLASDTSADSSRQTSEVDVDGKRQKTRRLTGYSVRDGTYCENQFMSWPQTYATSKSFHYKPLFGQEDSNTGQAPICGMLHSSDAVEENNLSKSLLKFSPSDMSNRRKRRRDGTIIYYSATPFYTDLSGDAGSVPAPTSRPSRGWDRPGPTTQFPCSRPLRSAFNFTADHLPLNELADKIEGADDGSLEFTADSGSEDSVELEFDLPSSDEHQPINVPPMEPCGLGGIMPDDCFMITVKTNRTNYDLKSLPPWAQRFHADKAIEDISGRLAAKAITSPTQLASRPSAEGASPAVEIEYMAIRSKRLPEVPLPPAIFFHLTSNNASPDNAFGSEADDHSFH